MVLLPASYIAPVDSPPSHSKPSGCTSEYAPFSDDSKSLATGWGAQMKFGVSNLRTGSGIRLNT